MTRFREQQLLFDFTGIIEETIADFITLLLTLISLSWSPILETESIRYQI